MRRTCAWYSLILHFSERADIHALPFGSQDTSSEVRRYAWQLALARRAHIDVPLMLSLALAEADTQVTRLIGTYLERRGNRSHPYGRSFEQGEEYAGRGQRELLLEFHLIPRHFLERSAVPRRLAFGLNLPRRSAQFLHGHAPVGARYVHRSSTTMRQRTWPWEWSCRR